MSPLPESKKATKPTEGNWRWVDNETIRELFNGCSVIMSDEIDDAIIATIGEDVPGYEANAKLFAAAKDMAEALQATLEAHGACDGRGCFCEAARAALLKAGL